MPFEVFDYEIFEAPEKGKLFGRIVGWRRHGKRFLGTVESQVGSKLKVFVFDKAGYGSRRTTINLSQAEFFD